jgi:hypothetical protein
MAEGRPEKIIFDLPTQIDNRFAAAFDTQLVEATTDSWHSWFGLLEIYAEKCGHARVIKRFETTEGFKLGQWVNSQRSRRDLLTDDKIARLESLQGWVWDVLTYKWEQGYAYLQAFVEREECARFLLSYKTADGYALGIWVGNQKKNKDRLSDDRIARLESLPGWEWKA